MDFDDHEDEQDDDMGMPVVSASYDSLTNSAAVAGGGEAAAAARPKMGGPTTTAAASGDVSRKSGGKYRECLKNHAVVLGGHAVDGCGEFMPAGEEGTLDALKCAACSCHRNFHRKETEGGDLLYHHNHHHHHHQISQFYRAPAGYLQVTPHSRPLALPSTSGGGGGDDQEDMSNPSGGAGGSGGMGGSSGKKRFRTKFTQEQKDKMLAFAESLGWRIQKHDEAAVHQFCTETCVKRHVLKVWMHNNKHTLGKKP